MAYGVKYRLDFSDSEGNKRRLEIFKKDYDGIVFPMIGSASPINITWEQDNDFYDPLIASNCEVNLIQTDFVTYEDFYDFDEREFLIKVYYADSVGKHWENYEINWEEANLYWGDESEVWNAIQERWEDYNVGWQEGPNEFIWRPFWQGYLIQDTYQQRISQAPFDVSFKGVDGIGLLKGVDFPVAPNNNVSLWECLHTILYETGLDYTIYVKTDIKEQNVENFTNVFEDVKINSSTYTDEDTFKFDCSSVLYSILNGFNCRIFQTDSDFYIVNNGDLATFENITYRAYDKNGIYINDVIKSNILKIPYDLKPIGDDLIKETSGGIIEVKNVIDFARQLNYIPNGNFEDDFTSWTIVDSDLVSIKDLGVKGKSANILGVYEGAFNTILYNEFLSKVEVDEYQETKFDFSFLVQIENGGFPSQVARYNIPYTLSHSFRQYINGEPTENYKIFYYNSEDELWQEDLRVINFFQYNGRGDWLKYNKNILFDFGDLSADYLPHNFKIEFQQPSKQSGGPHISMNLGGVVIEWETLLYLKDVNGIAEKFLFSNEKSNSISRQITDKNLTNTLEYEDIYQGSTFNQFIKGYLAPIDDANRGLIVKFIRPVDEQYRFIEDITSQQRLNDNRDKMQRYEGTLKKMDTRKPLFLYERIKVDYNLFKEDLPLIIDSFKYNVKQNLYEFTGHIGNQVTDVPMEFKSNQVTYPIESQVVCKTYSVQNNNLINDATIGYYDCDGVWTKEIVPADSGTPDFCASSTPIKISGPDVIVTLEADVCTLGTFYYSLKKCSDDSLGWRTEQLTSEIDLLIDNRVQDASLNDYVVTGQTTEGTSVGIVTDTEQFGCEIAPTLTEFLRSSSPFPNPCEATPDTPAYHDGDGVYPVVGDLVYTQPNGINKLGAGQYLMVNSTYISIEVGNSGLVTAVTDCTVPLQYYRISNCQTGFEFLTSQNINEIDLSISDRVFYDGEYYVVFGVGTNGTKIGPVVPTGETNCPSIPQTFWYALTKCSDDSNGWRSEQTTNEITLSNNDRVSVGNEFYIVSGLTYNATSVGLVVDTGEVGCPVPEILYYELIKCSDNSDGWITNQTTQQISLSNNDRVSAEGEFYTVVGTATLGYNVGNVTDTGEVGCPIIPENNYYTLTKCSDSSTGYISQQTTQQISLNNGDRVRDLNFVDYTVTGTATSGNNIGIISDTGLTGCPAPAPSNAFVTTWDTRIIRSGSTPSNQIQLFLDINGNYNGTIDWGDGLVESLNSYGDRFHTYQTPGIYEVRITGTIEGWRSNSDSDKLLSVKQWGSLRLASTNLSSNIGSNFRGCKNLDLSQVTDVLDLTNVTKLDFTFNGCDNLTTINRANEWDLSNVISFIATFSGCSNYNQDLTSWNAGGQATSITEMFAGCTSFNQDLSGWDVSNVGNARQSFQNTGLVPANLDAIYNSWGYQNLKNGVTISFFPTKYTSAGAAGRAAMDYHWDIFDGGLE